MMSRRILVATLLGLAACGRGDQKQGTAADSLQRDLSLAPADTTAQINDRPAADTSHPVSTPAATTPAPAPTPTQPAPKPPAPKPAAPQAPTHYTLASGTDAGGRFSRHHHFAPQQGGGDDDRDRD